MMMDYIRFWETKDKFSTDRLGMAPKWGTEICVLIRFGTYGFGTQP